MGFVDKTPEGRYQAHFRDPAGQRRVDDPDGEGVAEVEPASNCCHCGCRPSSPTPTRSSPPTSPNTPEAPDQQREPASRVDLLDGPWYSTEELAAMLGVDASSIRRWRTSNPPQGPPFIRLSSRVTIYSASDVETWLHAKRIDPERAA